MTWDTTTPLGSESILNGDNRIRELKTDIQTALRGNAADGDEAKFPGSDTANPVFRYRGLKGTTAARPTAGQYGLYFNTTLNAVQRDNGSSWDTVGTMIPSGTVMLFFQASAPTGWTQVTTQNDKALRIVSGTGAGTGGTHALSTPPSTAHTHTMGNHTHSTPAHTHTLDTIQTFTSDDGAGITADVMVRTDGAPNLDKMSVGGTGGAGSRTYVIPSRNTVSGGSGTSGAPSSNTSDSGSPTAFAPQYVDIIACSKD